MNNATPETTSPDRALERLLAGNERYVESRQIHPNQTHDRRAALRHGQRPFAVIVGCSDSQVPPELVFDLGLGDLFVVRIAGNILDDVILGSVEYAAVHVHTPLIVVLGHSKCEAVGATAAGGELEGHIPSIVEAIKPAVDLARDRPGDLVDNAARVNASMVAERLKSESPILSKLVGAGALKIVAAFYDLNTGVVEILS